MNLVEQRLRWRAEFNSGERPELEPLKHYESIRCSETERMSAQVEKLCEYILYLESKIQVISEPLFTKCATCGQDVEDWIEHATGKAKCENKIAKEWNAFIDKQKELRKCKD